MAKKPEESEVVEEVSESAPLEKVVADFGREDLNALRDAVNALIERA
jgi:hypothetical protein